MKLDSKEKLMNDFNKAITSTDFKSIKTTSPDFMHTLFIGMMWKLLSDIPEEESDDCQDIRDEIAGAEKYLEWYVDTSDSQYKQMAVDELRHAKFLINKELSKNDIPEERKIKLQELERERNAIADKIA